MGVIGSLKSNLSTKKFFSKTSSSPASVRKSENIFLATFGHFSQVSGTAIPSIKDIDFILSEFNLAYIRPKAQPQS